MTEDASDLTATTVAFINGELTTLPSSLIGREGEFLNAFLQSHNDRIDDPGELATQLIRWQASINDDSCALGISARVVEMANADSFHPGLQSVLDAISERNSAQVPAVIAAQLHFAQANMNSLRHGEAAFEDPFLRGLCLLAEHGCDHAWRLRQYAMFLALRGRLCEIDSCLPLDANDDDEIVDFAAVTTADFQALRFIDAVETGRVDEAQPMAYAIANDALDPRLGELLAAYDTVLMTWQRSILGQVLDEEPAIADDPLAMSMDTLMRRDRAALLRIIEEWNYEEVDTASTLYGYQSLRLALALRDEELASTLLERRRSAGLGHWLDGVMQARLDLLIGNIASASDHFCRAIRHAESYNALGRVDAELRLAIETSPIHIMYLGHRIHETPSWTIPLNPFSAVRKGVRCDDAMEAWSNVEFHG